jgi:hypothetical protein
MNAITLGPWTKFAGLDNDKQPLLPPEDDQQRVTAHQADGVIVDQRTGEVRRAPGSSVLSAAAPSGGPVRGIFEYQGQAGRIVICRTRTGYYQLNDSRTTWTLMHAAALRDSVQVPSFAQLGNYLAIVDGEQAFYWDGVSQYLTPWRGGDIEAPRYTGQATRQRPALDWTTGTTFKAGKGYEVFYTLYNASTGEESPPSQLMTARPGSADRNLIIKTGYALTGAGQAADGKRGAGFGWWVVPSGVTDVRFYRSAADTPGTWYLIDSGVGGSVDVDSGTEGDEITTTITGDGVSATSLLSYLGPPQGATKVCAHVGRLFVCGSPAYPNRLWWTDTGSLNFSATNFLDVGRSSDPIVSVVSFPLATATLGILCRHSVWSLSGYDETTFAAGLRQAAQGPGCLAPHATPVVDGKCYFWGANGVFMFDGLTVVPIDKGIAGLFAQAIQGVA